MNWFYQPLESAAQLLAAPEIADRPSIIDAGSPLITAPQQCTAREFTGYGLVLIASAIISSFTPPVNAAEYHYGTHQAAVHDAGTRGSFTFHYPHAGTVVADQPFAGILTTPQVASNLQPQVFKANVAALTPPPNRPTTWTSPQPFGVDQGRVERTQVQLLIPPPNRAKTPWTLPQPYDVQQGSFYGPLAEAIVSPPNRPQTWTTPQPFDALQGSIYHTLIQQFIDPPNRPEFVTNPQTPEQVYSGLFKAWQYVTVQDPPLRGSITTQAEFPQNAPSSVRGDVAQYAPVQPTPTGTSFEYGSHEAWIRQQDNRSSVWYNPPRSADSPPQRPYITTAAEFPRLAPSSFKVVNPEWVPPAPPPPSYPPVNPRYQYGTHQLHHLQSSNRISLVIPWQISIYEFYFISQEPIGERNEDYSLRPSSVFHQRPAEGIPPVPLDDLPVTIRTLPQPYVNLQGQVYRQQLNALLETLTIRDLASFTLPQTFQARNDSQVYHQPPVGVQPPVHYWLNGTLPQSTQLYEVNRSRVSTQNAALLPNIPVANVYVDLTGIEVNIYQGTLRPEVKKYVGRIVTEPKLIGATSQLEPPFDFSLYMDAGETLLTATVVSSVYSGVDPTPSAIRSGSPVIDGNRVDQMMRGGVEGCVYELLCTATTSLGQTLQQSTYFYVEPHLP